MSRIFNRTLEQYWSDPHSSFDDVVDRFLESDDTGYFLDAPHELCVVNRSSFPVLMLMSIPASVTSVAPVHRTGFFTVTRLESNDVAIGRAFEWKPAVKTGETYTGPAYEGNTIQPFSVDLKQRVPDLAWRPGTLSVRFVHLDQVSEPVSVTLVQTPHGPVDREVEAFVVANRGRGYPKAVFPAHDADALLGYRLYPYLPAPAEAGVTISLDTPEVKLNDESWNLRGALRLPLLPREVVREAEGGGGDRLAQLGGAGWEDVGDEHAVGVIPVTLLMTGPDCLDPGVITLQVPVYSNVNGADLPGELLEGHFNVNLRKMEGVPLHAEKLYLYAMSGAHLSEACSLTIARD